MSILGRCWWIRPSRKCRKAGQRTTTGSAPAHHSLARSGIDWILLDSQHGAWGLDAAFAARMAIAGGIATPMARVARNHYTLIGRLLDQGTPGIVVPRVHSPESTRAVAEACRLPSAGTRSCGIGEASVSGADQAWQFLSFAGTDARFTPSAARAGLAVFAR